MNNAVRIELGYLQAIHALNNTIIELEYLTGKWSLHEESVYRYIAVLFLLASCSSSPEKPVEEEKEADANSVTLTDAQIKKCRYRDRRRAIAKPEFGIKSERGSGCAAAEHCIGKFSVRRLSEKYNPVAGHAREQRAGNWHHRRSGAGAITTGLPDGPGPVTFFATGVRPAKELSEQQVSSAKTFQQVQSDHAAQKVLVKGLAEKLRLININPASLNENKISRSVPIYSPITGFVSKVNVNIGKFVNATDVLFELINPDDIHAALTVFEKDMPKIKVDQLVKVSIRWRTGKEYDCEVILVTHNVDINRSGTFIVILRPGQRTFYRACS